MIHPDIEQVLYTEEQLHSRVREVGEQIAADYAGREHPPQLPEAVSAVL